MRGVVGDDVPAVPVKTAALVLAAGSGSRLGRGPKALLPWAGETLLRRAARAAHEADLECVVTCGAGAAETRAQVEDLPAVRTVDVPDHREGLSRSWRAGVHAVAERAGEPEQTAVLVMLVDQPGVGAAVLRRLVDRHVPGRVTRAAWAGAPGHPLVMPLADAVRAAALSTGDRGARDWLRSHPDRIDPVECSDLGHGADIDTEDDLRGLC